MSESALLDAYKAEVLRLRDQLEKSQHFVKTVADASAAAGIPDAMLEMIGLGGAAPLLRENELVLRGPKDLGPVVDAIGAELREGRERSGQVGLTGFSRLLAAAEIAARDPLDEDEGKRARSVLRLAAVLAQAEAKMIRPDEERLLMTLCTTVANEAQMFRDLVLRARQFIMLIPAGGAAQRQAKAKMIHALREALDTPSALAVFETAVAQLKTEPENVVPFAGPRRIEDIRES